MSGKNIHVKFVISLSMDCISGRNIWGQGDIVRGRARGTRGRRGGFRGYAGRRAMGGKGGKGGKGRFKEVEGRSKGRGRRGLVMGRGRSKGGKRVGRNTKEIRRKMFKIVNKERKSNNDSRNWSIQIDCFVLGLLKIWPIYTVIFYFGIL